MHHPVTNNGRLSVALRAVERRTAGPGVAVAVAVTVVGWLIAYALAGFPEWMGTVLQVAAAVVTLVMVFLIQHTQRRTETAIQLKLDALIRTSDADDGLAEIEHAEGDELERHHRNPQLAGDLPR